MSVLSDILSSRSRAQMFSLLFDGSEQEFYVRELERLSGLSVMTIKQELANLSNLDLVISRKSGNRHYYRANKTHQLYGDIMSMVSKTTGIIPHLKTVLTDQRILLAFVFGSFARTEEKIGSDIDLFVVGDLGMRDLSKLLTGCQEKFDREINPHVVSKAEFIKGLKDSDSFISRVAAAEKTWVKGGNDELAKIRG